MGELILAIVAVVAIYLLRDVLASIVNGIVDRAGDAVVDAASKADSPGVGERDEAGATDKRRESHAEMHDA